MRILAIDDDNFILELLPVLLASSGYHDVDVCASPEKALEKLVNGDSRYDCLFLDIKMPGMDGIALCRKIRDLETYKDTPIIMLTAMSDRTNIDQAFAAGATDYVTKPFDVTEIGARVRIAEKLYVAQKAVLEYRAAGLSPNNDNAVKLPFLDAQHFQNIDGAVDYKALTNYLGQLSKTGLYSSNVFAVKIDQAADIYGLTNALEFSHVLTTVADAISETLRANGFFLMSYAGCGHFVCVTHGVCEDFENATERALQSFVDAKAPAFDTGAIIDITISVGKSLRPAVSVYKRTDRIFRAAIARVEAKFDAKCAGKIQTRLHRT